MRAFSDPSVSAERDRPIEEEYNVVEIPGAPVNSSESIHSSSASSSSEIPLDARRREERLAEQRSTQKAADRTAQKARLANAPPPIDTQHATRSEIALHNDIADLQKHRDADHDQIEELVYGLNRYDAINKVQISEHRRTQEE